MTDFETWLLDNSDRIYRYWVYKRMFTPHEQEMKYVDQSCFEDVTANEGYIREAIELPDGDILLGFELPDMETQYIEYYKLSEINLAWSKRGQDEWNEEEYG